MQHHHKSRLAIEGFVFCFKMLVLYMFYYMGWVNFAFIRDGVKCRLMADEFIKLFSENK